MPSTRLLLSLLLASGLAALPSKPAAGAKGPLPKGSCAVCGMFVANFPDWAAVVTFRDGSQAWFDGPKDLFTYLLDLKRYAPKRAATDITGIQVKDYYALRLTDARKASFVMGSDIMGPMGKELVPFSTEAGARDFLKDHHGKKVLSFAEINLGTLKDLE
ncbi:MAG: nitrous oxide reductase accessory protein NosL [Holophagaceae bacterium]|nr:nitrous oxide reductase accessory protein NosL [Holophagaceae bacterium]